MKTRSRNAISCLEGLSITFLGFCTKLISMLVEFAIFLEDFGESRGVVNPSKRYDLENPRNETLPNHFCFNKKS